MRTRTASQRIRWQQAVTYNVTRNIIDAETRAKQAKAQRKATEGTKGGIKL